MDGWIVCNFVIFNTSASEPSPNMIQSHNYIVLEHQTASSINMDLKINKKQTHYFHNNCWSIYQMKGMKNKLTDRLSEVKHRQHALNRTGSWR